MPNPISPGVSPGSYRRPARAGLLRLTGRTLVPKGVSAALMLWMAAASTWVLVAPAAKAEFPKATFGGEVRLRAEALDNALDLEGDRDDSYNYYRMRYRLWVDATPREGLKFYFRLGNEYRWGVYEGATRDTLVRDLASIRDPESRVSLDNGWAEIRIPRAPGFSFRFGRMDLMYGEGFLIFDGTPSDGSASSYFDAMKLTWEDAATTVDLIGAVVQSEGLAGRAKPGKGKAAGSPVHDQNLFGLYLHRKAADLYALYREQGTTTSLSGVAHPQQWTAALGARLAILPEGGWRVAAEGAVETGEYGGRLRGACGPRPDRRAFGGYARSGWTGAGAWRPGLELGGLYLSGDDPGTAGRYEGWDGFYSEWPKYSELYVYTLFDQTTRITDAAGTPRDDPGTWTNLEAIWLEARIKPAPAVTASTRIATLMAPQWTGPGRGGRLRGNLLTAKVGFAPWPGLEAQAIGEVFDPGSFYRFESAGRTYQNDRAWYGQIQVTARF